MRPHFVTALAALLATAAPAPGQGTLLIGNKGEDSLSFVDLATGRERRRVPTGRMPHEILEPHPFQDAYRLLERMDHCCRFGRRRRAEGKQAPLPQPVDL